MRLMPWCMIVAIVSAGGFVFGWAVGMALVQISGDYVVLVTDYTSRGLSAGFVAGTTLAAFHVIGRIPPSNFNSLLSALVVLGIVTGGTVCAGAIVGYLISCIPVAIPEHANLGHPRRYVLFLAIHYSWQYSILLGTLVSSLYVWRERQNELAGRT